MTSKKTRSRSRSSNSGGAVLALAAAAGVLWYLFTRKPGAAAAGGGGGFFFEPGLPSPEEAYIPVITTAPPGYQTTRITSPYARATQAPQLPPGTTPFVQQRVEAAFAAGTLTERQRLNIERPSAPMYFTPSVNGVAVTEFGSEAAARAALADYMSRFV